MYIDFKGTKIFILFSHFLKILKISNKKHFKCAPITGHLVSSEIKALAPVPQCVFATLNF